MTARPTSPVASITGSFAAAPVAASPSPKIVPSEDSRKYVEECKQFQLHELMTEQRHPKTMHLSSDIKHTTVTGIEELLSVDFDISKKFEQMAQHPELLEQAATSVVNAIREGKKIYLYGCGATGRLAKQVESSFWRPFWEHFKDHPKLSKVMNQLIGEMTGADRALISSLEGFEDLQVIGKLQLQDHGIQGGDVVFAITEGGETSSVIGTILAAANQEGAQKENLFFIYNNPDELLRPFDRSREVLDNDLITKIPLFTGPQSITGSTRMQATTSETFVMGVILEHAIHQVLKDHLDEDEIAEFGFQDLTLGERLLSFLPVQRAVYDKKVEIAKFTDLETSTYEKTKKSTYFALDMLVTIFTDCVERAPTFRLHPLDTISETVKKSWTRIWTEGVDGAEAWVNFLRRHFKGLSSDIYEGPFKSIESAFLKQKALTSLTKAGDDQQHLYDFSVDPSQLEQGDIGVVVLGANESINSTPLSIFKKKGMSTVVLQAGSKEMKFESDLSIHIPIDSDHDPLNVRQHIALKMLLNAHSTGIMAKLGRVVGNTMTNVNPGNLKLIGRATFLIQLHVNDYNRDLSYADANAYLHEAMDYVQKTQKVNVVSEVPLSIVKILEDVSWEDAERILGEFGLEGYLLSKQGK